MKGVYLAYGNYLNPDYKKASPIINLLIPPPHRLRHLYCIGGTGSGKTMFMESVISQDIKGKAAFGLIDPEGDLYTRTISHFLIENPDTPLDELAEKLVLIEPSNDRYALPLNCLKALGDYKPYTIVDNMLFAFRKAWKDSWGDRMADIMRNSMLLLIEHGYTLNEMPKLLNDKQFRTNLAKRSKNQDLRGFWLEHLEGIRASEYRYWIESTRNKISAFISNPYIRPLISQKETIDFKEIMDSGKTCLIYISQDHLKESGDLLGMLLVTKMLMSAMAREDISSGNTNPWYLYIDEFQNYATDSFLEILTQARKRGLGLFIQHQNLSQPPFDENKEFINTILSNAHTQVYFSLSRHDAEKMAKEIFGATGDKVKTRKKHWLWGDYGEPRFWSVQEEWEHFFSELENQATQECYVRLKGLNENRPFVGRTYQMDGKLAGDPDKLAELKELCFKRHCVPIEKVREEYTDRLNEINEILNPSDDGIDEGEPARHAQIDLEREGE